MKLQHLVRFNKFIYFFLICMFAWCLSFCNNKIGFIYDLLCDQEQNVRKMHFLIVSMIANPLNKLFCQSKGWGHCMSVGLQPIKPSLPPPPTPSTLCFWEPLNMGEKFWRVIASIPPLPPPNPLLWVTLYMGEKFWRVIEIINQLIILFVDEKTMAQYI